MNVYLLILTVAFSYSTQAEVGVGGPCSLDHDGLDPRNGKYLSDCDDTSFCSGAVNGTCRPRRCRRDLFPFGYEGQSASSIPPYCGQGTYCPDGGNECRPLLAIGQSCQRDRDEQCAPPPNWQRLTSDRNFNGSLCLASVCTFANMTLGQPCILDVVGYSDGDAFNNTITRHNCQTPKFYCDNILHQCVPTKAQDFSCTSDQECQSFNCGSQRTCVEPAGTPTHVETWRVVLTGMCVLAAMAAVVVMLTFIHKRFRLRRYREVQEYYEEQISLRQSLAVLHASAADRYGREKSGYD